MNETTYAESPHQRPDIPRRRALRLLAVDDDGYVRVGHQATIVGQRPGGKPSLSRTTTPS